jgi:hypothetical protein
MVIEGLLVFEELSHNPFEVYMPTLVVIELA